MEWKFTVKSPPWINAFWYLIQHNVPHIVRLQMFVAVDSSGLLWIYIFFVLVWLTQFHLLWKNVNSPFGTFTYHTAISGIHFSWRPNVSAYVKKSFEKLTLSEKYLYLFWQLWQMVKVSREKNWLGEYYTFDSGIDMLLYAGTCLMVD